MSEQNYQLNVCPKCGARHVTPRRKMRHLGAWKHPLSAFPVLRIGHGICRDCMTTILTVALDEAWAERAEEESLIYPNYTEN